MITPIEKRSRTFRITNANITVHGYSAGTAVLSVTTVSDGGDTISVWVSPEDLRYLAGKLLSCAEDVCQDLKQE